VVTLAIEATELVRAFSYRKGRKRRGDGSDGAAERRVVALDGVSLTVDPGEIRGLLGPNGAGKTTLVKILSTVLLPTTGSARIFGHDVVSAVSSVRAGIGVVFGGERGLYGRLSARRNLEYWAALYRLDHRTVRDRVNQLIDEFGLHEFADTPMDRMSRGMKQRVHLARGMLSNPALLFLDEPTMGMDPVAAREFHRLIGRLRATDITVLLTTHDMAEAELLCDRVTLIDHGRLLGTESPDQVGRWINAHERVEAQITQPRILAAIDSVPGVVGIEPLNGGWVRINASGAAAISAVLRLIVQEGVTALRVEKPSLQEVYLELIGERGMKV
jgi:ABC-2 type transport system ATP-binding protein